MARYALVSPQDAVSRYSESVVPTVATKPGWRWLPATPASFPSVNHDTQLVEGPSVTVGASEVTESYTVRDKTAQELDSDKQAKVDNFDVLAFKVAFDIENRVRVLESRATVTQAQYKNALKAAL